MILTLTDFRAAGACSHQLAMLGTMFGETAEVTREHLYLAYDQRLDLMFLARMLLTRRRFVHYSRAIEVGRHTAARCIARYRRMKNQIRHELIRDELDIVRRNTVMLLWVSLNGA